MSRSTRRFGGGPPPGRRRSGEPGFAQSPGEEGLAEPGEDTGAEGSGFLLDVLRTARERWIVAAGTFATTLLVVVVGTLLQSPVYEASTLLLVKSLGREFIYRSEVGDQSFAPRDRESLILSELQILRIPDVMASVVRSMGIERLYPKLLEADLSEEARVQKATQWFGNGLSAQALRDTDVIRVAYRHRDPVAAAEAVNLLVEHFKEKHLQVFGEPEAASFLEDKAVHYRDRLRASEERLQAFQAEHEAFALKDPDAFLLRQRSELKENLREVQGEITSTRQLYAHEDPAIARAKTQILELQLREKDLAAGASGTKLELEETREKIRLVREFLAAREREIARRRRDVLRLLQEQEADIQARLDHVAQELKGLSELAARHRVLAREVEVSEQNYRSFMARAEEARVSAEMDLEKIANISVIQRAIPPLDPVKPRKLLNLAVGVTVGAVLALLLPYVLAPFRSPPD